MAYTTPRDEFPVPGPRRWERRRLAGEDAGAPGEETLVAT